VDVALLVAAGLVVVCVVVCLFVWPVRETGHRTFASVLDHYRETREADRRADELLRDVLTPDEYTRLQERGFLDVRSGRFPGRIYRVPRDGGIVVLRENGRSVGGLCVQATTPMPAADSVAMHKLMIEGAESEYLRRANHLSIGALTRYGLGVLYDR